MEIGLTNSGSLAERCARTLERRLLGLPAGHRLPPERALAVELEVTRVTLRSALARLEAKGLLDVRQGSGYTVRDFRVVGGPALLPALAAEAEEAGALAPLVEQMLTVRRHLARALLERLVERRPDPAPVALAVQAFGACDPTDLEALAQADAGVLVALVAVAEAPVLGLTLNPIRQLLAELAPLRAAMYRDPADNLRGWQALLAWLRAPEAAGVEAVLALLAARDLETVRRLG